MLNVPLTDALEEIADPRSIELDLTAIEGPSNDSSAPTVSTDLHEHPFHHTLGYLLYKTRCRCELDGDTLIILPQDAAENGP